MAELFQLEVQELPRQSFDQAHLCDEDSHEPNPLCDWRCIRCDCLLCTTCGKQIDQCPKGGRHG